MKHTRRLGMYLWACPSCGWVNGRHVRKHSTKCVNCGSYRNEKRNVAIIIGASQYMLLDRNRNRNHRTGCPGKRGGNGIERANVQTYNDGTPWI